MALYVPAGRRRRRLIIAIGAALVGGLVIGALVGRAAAPSVDDRVNDVRVGAARATARLEALPLEYEKQLSGSRQFANGGGVGDALRQTRRDLDGVVGDAPWISAAQTRRLHVVTDGLERAAQSRVTSAEFERQLGGAEAAIGEVFGLSGATG